MKRVIVHENKTLRNLGGALLALAGIVWIVATLLWGNDNPAGPYFFVVFLLLCGVLLLMDYKLRRFVVKDETCCYRTMFGRSKCFQVQEIQEVQIKSRGSDILIYLISCQGKKLVRLEKNMDGIDDLLDYLRGRGIIVKRMPEISKTADEVSEVEHRQKSADMNTRFYQSPEWFDMLRLFSRLLNIFGVLLTVVAFILPVTKAAVIYVCYPFAVYLFYCLFHDAVAILEPDQPSKTWKKKHIRLPWLALTLLAICAIRDASLINFPGQWGFLLFIPATIIILGVPYWLLIHPTKKVTLLLCGMLFIYGVINMTYLNVMFPAEPPAHELAEIVSMDTSGGGRRIRRYRISIYSHGTEMSLNISGALYDILENGDVVQICKRTSIFGIEYWMVHL